MFASKVTKQVVFEDGGSVVIRKLNHSALDRAREAKSSKGARSLRDFGGEVLKVLRSDEYTALQEKKAEDPNAVREARYASFDRGVVLVAGIVSWNADVKLTPEAIEDLDEGTADTIFKEIVDLSLPPLDPKVAAVKEGNA